MKQANHEAFVRRAIALAGQGALVERVRGPFGAVVVRHGEIVGEGCERAVPEHDPTWHAEVAAIRAACRRLATPDLSGCVLHTCCERCPMCHAACWRARLDRMYYAATTDNIQTYTAVRGLRARAAWPLQPFRPFLTVTGVSMLREPARLTY